MKKQSIIRFSTGLAVLLSLAAAGTLASCAPAEDEGQPVSVTFADMTWDSVRVHNRIVAFILEEGYGGYTIDYTQGATTAMATGLRQGDVDVILESWHNNWNDFYDEAMAAGDFVDLGPNYPEAPQGWYVPTYVIEGDPERDIEPTAPGLETIEDLPEYWEAFKDPEEPNKGRLMVGPPGWAVTETNEQVMEEHGLTDYYTAFLPGSDAALKASMESAYRRGEPWLGYHWEPTWILGKLDMTMIEGVGLSSGLVHKLVHPSMEERSPELVGLLERYETTLDQNNAFLAQMQENDWDYDEAAEWYLREYENYWTTWVDDEVAERVRSALE